jgi:hypothetical protein
MATLTVGQLTELQTLLERVPFRERLSTLLRLGVPAEEAMGVQDCTAHPGWHILPHTSALSFDGTVVWCRGCWKWMQQ